MAVVDHCQSQSSGIGIEKASHRAPEQKDSGQSLEQRQLELETHPSLQRRMVRYLTKIIEVLGRPNRMATHCSALVAPDCQ
jgi:hypothetical protein